MFFRIGLEVRPQVWCQCVFGLNSLVIVVEKTVSVPRQHWFAAICSMQNGGQAWPFRWKLQVIPREAGFLSQSDNDDSLPVLRGEVLAVNDSVMHVVAEFVPQGLQDDPECITLVMRNQILDVFQKERFGALGGNNARHVKEKRALGGAFEAMWATE